MTLLKERTTTNGVGVDTKFTWQVTTCRYTSRENMQSEHWLLLDGKHTGYRILKVGNQGEWHFSAHEHDRVARKIPSEWNESYRQARTWLIERYQADHPVATPPEESEQDPIKEKKGGGIYGYHHEVERLIKGRFRQATNELEDLRRKLGSPLIDQGLLKARITLTRGRIKELETLLSALHSHLDHAG